MPTPARQNKRPDQSHVQDSPEAWHHPQACSVQQNGLSEVDGFKRIAADLQALLSLLVTEHESRVQSLQLNVKRLRGQLHSSQGAGTEETIEEREVSPHSRANTRDESQEDLYSPSFRSHSKGCTNTTDGPQEVPDYISSTSNSKGCTHTRDESQEDPYLSSTSHSTLHRSGSRVSASSAITTRSKVSWYEKVHDAHRSKRWISHSSLNLMNAKPPSFSATLSCLERFVLGHNFELISGAVIIANTVVMAFQLQYDGFDLGHSVRPGTYTKNAAEVWPGADKIFTTLNMGFNVAFLVELLLRLFAHGSKSIRIGWMWFDALIVGSSFADTFVAGANIGIDPTMIRLVRLVRLVRMLKVFKAMESFDSLFLLLKSIQASVGALVWSLLLLAIMQIATGLFLCQVLQGFIDDEGNNMEIRDRVFDFYGTFSRTMLTMVEITFANWVPSCRLLVEEVNELFFLFYVVYRCIFCFSVLKVIAAVFITETNRVLANDDELVLMKKTREKEVYMSKMRKLLTDIDIEKDGLITWLEIQSFLATPDLASELSIVGMNRTDLEKLFWLIEVDGAVEIEKFLTMITELRGEAKTVDLFNLFKVLLKMDHKLCLSLKIADDDDEQEDALKKIGQGEDLIDTVYQE